MRIQVLALCCCFASTCLAEETKGSFFDDFDTFNKDRWTISDGWSNGDHQSCMWNNKNVKLEGGILQLMLTRNPVKNKSHSCAEVQSWGAYSYGTYEIRMRTPKGSGTVTAFFTYSGKPAFDQPHDELDIEIAGQRTEKIITNYYVDGKSVGYKELPLNFDSSSGMNDYAFEWTSQSIKWFVNGNLVREVKATDSNYPTHRSKIIMIFWNSKIMPDWLGPFEEILFPLKTEIEWVAFTKAGDPCQFMESVVCKLAPPQ